ncbi:MAG: GTP-binding protein, partial [Verrucomicrobiae bacterium]|nr:GTP-binding protein [Verrucomicrobiae bacterium]
CLLVVDAFDGPQAQTRFVLRRALEAGLMPIVVINKVDRPHADPVGAHDKVVDLMLELHAHDQQLNFPTIYASAKEGYARMDLKDANGDMTPLFETIIRHIPPPQADANAPLQILIANLDYSDYVGRIALGKIYGGRIRLDDSVVCIHKDGRRERARVTKLFAFSGLQRIEMEEACAGDIVGIAGFEEVAIGETICDSEEREPVPFVEIDPPTIQMQFAVNNGPLAGRDGKLVTARNIRDRLIRETRTNISLSVEDTPDGNVFIVSARGEMQIAILVEQMRREGYEVLVSRPEVIYRKGPNGETLEPIETLWLEIPQECLGDIIQNLAMRRAEITHMEHHGSTSAQGGHVTIEAVIPTRGLIGFETDLMNLARGTAVMSHLFREYGPHRGEIDTRRGGVLIATEDGVATAYALDYIQERGRMFIGPGELVYRGMIVGETGRPEDIAVNVCRTKKLTNMRSQGEGKGIQLEPPLKMSLERCIEYIGPDEYVEATPKNLRLRKRILNEHERKRHELRRTEKVAAA